MVEFSVARQVSSSRLTGEPFALVPVAQLLFRFAMVGRGRSMCRLGTRPVTVVLPCCATLTLLIFAGLMKPMNEWKPGGPNSCQYEGSPGLMKVSLACVPSRVETCTHCSPFTARSTPGVAHTS